jgi:PhzF family phenazine biosynthesis protein
MTLSIYQIDAFTAVPFGGNPAAVVPLQRWLPEELMGAIASENNLSETAFVLGGEGEYELRWFSPATEIDLCGHATLATAHLLSTVLGERRRQLRFHTRGGELEVIRRGASYSLYLPRQEAAPCDAPEELLRGLGSEPEEVLRAGSEYLAVFAERTQVERLSPRMEELAALPGGVIATAPGGREGFDFVSRVFAPAEGIPEDPVTGSAHAILLPYWGRRLGRDACTAAQLSRRGGVLQCRDRGGRIEIEGRAVLYMEGRIYLPEAGSADSAGSN